MSNGMMEHDDNQAPYQGVAQATSIPLTKNAPTSTDIATDTAVSFTQRVHHFLIQNNTTAVCYVELDTNASTASVQIAAGASWRDDIAVTTVHLYTAASQPINQASGIILRGWL